ncbi:MAG TPA: FtsX-like permease family protein, partial [Blastocatellia bacterium]|nr:FtsX-like permease family protein [Blastocatellia bacterium]
MEDIFAESVSQRRFIMSLISVFATLAFILASIGVYGVISFSLSQRTREIGIRIALGAQPRDVLKLALGQSMVCVLVGVGLGLAAAFVSTRLMSSLLYEVSATEPPTFIVVSLLLIGVSLLASYIPARRATKIAPSVALRYE